MSDKEQEINSKKLLKLLEPFAEGDISKLPKPTRAQTQESKTNRSVNIRCQICGGWHHKNVVHLDYVGHAAVTKRLLSVDPMWSWDFLTPDPEGGPKYDANGGLWITLTILGVTRKGYGDAEGKKGPNAVKEIIGDAIRNAAMRFGVALELWHKGAFASDPIEEAPQEPVGPIPFSEDEFNKHLDSFKAQLKGGKALKQIKTFTESRGFIITDEQCARITQ